MPRNLLSLGLVLGALAGAALGAGPASADSTVAADASAQNVTAYGSTAAWSRRAADGYHLVISHNGTIADAPVPVAAKAYDPDLGPTSSNGRVVVYARGGDLYRFDVGSTGERKLTSLSSSATESAPSFFKETIVFSRTTGARTGVYIKRPTRRLTRLFRTVAAETDVAATRVVGRFGERSKSIIRILNYNADDVRIVTRSESGERVASPTLTRFNAIWLRVGARASTVQRVGVNSHRGLDVLTASRTLPRGTTSLASTSIPTLYTNASGVHLIQPKLGFS